MSTTDGRGRAARRACTAVVASTALLLTGAGPAMAAVTGGIEVTPDPVVVDGKTVSNFRVDVPSRGESVESFTVRNITDEPRSARLYTAAVQDVDGTLQLGEEGSSEVAVLRPQVLTLEPGEVRTASFAVRGGDLPDDAMAALVVEVSNGSIVRRAATMVYLEPGRQVPLPLALVVLAVVLVLLAGAASAAVVRRRAGGDGAGPSTAAGRLGDAEQEAVTAARA